MNGLLDFIKTPEGQGLLSAAFGGLAGARRGQPLNSIGKAGMSGLLGYGQAVERQDLLAERAKADELRGLQMEQARVGMQKTQAEIEAAKQAQQRERAKQEALPNLFSAGQVTPGSITVPEMGGVEMFSQGVKVDRPSMRAGEGRLNVQAALSAGFKPEEITSLSNLQNIGMPEVARTIEVDDGRGGKAIRREDRFGRLVGDLAPAYVPPVQVNRGGSTEFVQPKPGLSLPMTGNPFSDLLLTDPNGAMVPNAPLINAKSQIGAASAPRTEIKVDARTGESLAGQIGPIVKGTREQALSGIKLVDSANRILDVAEQGNLYAGPFANIRLRSAQVADVLKIGGKDTAEKISNTRTVVRAMAEQGVAARSQLGGQAQISNTEQELLNKATSGDIGELTVGEIVQIAQLNDRLGRQLYSLHGSQLEAMQGNPGLKGMIPFYAVPPLPTTRQPKAAAPQAAPGNPRIDSLLKKYGG